MSGVFSHGKCILAGEHSVLRGGEALVVPVRSFTLKLDWKKSADGRLHIKPDAAVTPLTIALEKAASFLQHPLPHYDYSLSNSFPFSAGLGSSAALACAVVRFFAAEGATIRDPFKLALEIEHLFHGRSSGIDVACVLASAPIQYSTEHGPEDLVMTWRPPLYLIDTGDRSSTKGCVKKVEAANRPELDRKMQGAVSAIKSALRSEESDRFEQFALALDQAAACFDGWGLGVRPELADKLRAAGVRSLKPTGSGGGGFLLTLWPEPPPPDLDATPVWGGS